MYLQFYIFVLVELVCMYTFFLLGNSLSVSILLLFHGYTGFSCLSLRFRLLSSLLSDTPVRQKSLGVLQPEVLHAAELSELERRGIWALGFKNKGLGFKNKGLGFRVYGLGLRETQDSGHL